LSPPHTHTLLPSCPPAVDIKGKTGPKLKDFKEAVANSTPEINALKDDVEAFAKQFPTIGFEKATMRYQD
jgi:glycine hydroxymethyltransferase